MQSEKDKKETYEQELYAKKEFWDDRFSETKGFFDWYANWKEIKPIFYKNVKINTDNASCKVLMVGCGNSKLSEEMAIQDGFKDITNVDISGVVLDKMKVHTDSKPACKGFKYLEVDATDMHQF